MYCEETSARDASALGAPWSTATCETHGDSEVWEWHVTMVV
jgi:hypothetical protein